MTLPFDPHHQAIVSGVELESRRRLAVDRHLANVARAAGRTRSRRSRRAHDR